jgi:hypothetical protein
MNSIELITSRLGEELKIEFVKGRRFRSLRYGIGSNIKLFKTSWHTARRLFYYMEIIVIHYRK